MLFAGENKEKIIVTMTKCFHKETDALISDLLEAIMNFLVYTFLELSS